MAIMHINPYDANSLTLVTEHPTGPPVTHENVEKVIITRVTAGTRQPHAEITPVADNGGALVRFTATGESPIDRTQLILDE